MQCGLQCNAKEYHEQSDSADKPEIEHERFLWTIIKRIERRPMLRTYRGGLVLSIPGVGIWCTEG